MTSGEPLRLLWPPGHIAQAHRRQGLSEEAATDLRLPELITAMALPDTPPARQAKRERFAHQVLTHLLTEPELIAHRQSIVTDLLNNHSLRDRLESILPSLETLGDVPRAERYRPTAQPELERVARRLSDLELLVDVVRQLGEALTDPTIRSDGLVSVRTNLDAMRRAPDFAALEVELPKLRATLASVRSVILGVNLGPDLTPRSATILELRDSPIEGRRSLLWRLLGGSGTDRGLTPLQEGEASPLGRPNDLVRDLRHLLGQVVGPVHAALERFSQVSNDHVARLGPDLAFFLGAAHLLHRLSETALPVSPPTSAPIQDRCADVVDAYDPTLALAQPPSTIVVNAVRFGAECGRVWVLTGPNRGGKTTYTRCVGLTQVLFQAGLYVPAASARISPVDAIHTHFPTREESRPGLGRLDLEAERLAAIFQQATPHSLILLNEALSGTGALEALDLARGLVRGLRLLGARAIYVTHLHELATSVDEINASTPGDGTVASLLADSEDAADSVPPDSAGPLLPESAEAAPPHRAAAAPPAGAEPAPSERAEPAPPASPSTPRRSYRIVPRAPRGVSFAAEIAEQHGISYAQLAQLLRDRDLA
jgi:DNA mismatch repair protein MutS